MTPSEDFDLNQINRNSNEHILRMLLMSIITKNLTIINLIDELMNNVSKSHKKSLVDTKTNLTSMNSLMMPHAINVDLESFKINESATEIMFFSLSIVTVGINTIKMYMLNDNQLSINRTVAQDLSERLIEIKNTIELAICENVKSSSVRNLESSQKKQYMPAQKNKNYLTLEKNLANIISKEGIQEEHVDVLLNIILHQIRIYKAKMYRPAWKNRHEIGSSDMSAPEFLINYHSDDIIDGVVDIAYFRQIDKELVDAVELYLSQSERRGQNVIGALGLKFVASHPARNRRAEVQLEENELAEFRLHAEKHPWVARKGLSPSAFISETFKQWLGKGLLREHIKEVSPKLAGAYSVEVNRHPDRRLSGLGTRPHTRHGTSLEGEELTSSGWIKNEDLHPDQVAARRRAQALGRRPAKAPHK